MKNSKSGFFLALLALAGFVLVPAPTASAAATITIVNVDGPGEGFNDPFPRAPVGGNPGTTLGQQRLNAFTHAAGIWGSTLDSSVEIFIQASFDPLTCTANSAVLGSAGTILIVFDGGGGGIPPFPGLEANTFYGTALANKRLGFDAVTPADVPGQEALADDIRARFNSNIGLPGCLVGINWYYGFDLNHGNDIDLVTVLLHEFAHGLNFQQFASVTTGAQPGGLTDVFGKRILDLTTGKHWNQMTNAERVASAINTRRVVFDAPNVTAAVPGVLSFGYPLLRVNSPAGIAGNYEVGLAQFGPALTGAGVTGNVVLALDPADGAGPLTTDACSPLTNAAAVAGKIALLDRGTCGFTVKAKNAQNAGARAVVVANNVAGSPPPGLGGADPTITIPTVLITQADANTLKANLATGVNATLLLDLSVRAGADPVGGRALLYTPNPVQPGSTISHWDTSAFPNQLMEPAINGDLTHSVSPPRDLTLPLFRDIGWFPDADLDGVPDNVDCEPHSDFSPTVVIDGCDSGVPNTFFTDGCTISDLINHCAAGARNHGGFVSCVAHLGNDLKSAGIISGNQKGAIQSCAAHAH
ncbi:MAG TPA: PA domain-containing protein [Thermoanaerobaculia bacterium]|nr:PA domain-containing protein [Thermoanaerobaculia bacterium]